jgi:MYXO-CTERM domain-containing protein
MKKLTTSMALVLLGIAMFASSANAQATASLGDLILGFQTTNPTPAVGQTTNLEVDLGAYTNFIGLANGTTVNLTQGLTTAGQTGAFNINDLVTDYGTGGTGGNALNFEVSGEVPSSGVDEVFISQKSTAPTLGPDNSSAYSDLSTMIAAFNNGTAGTTGSTDNNITRSVSGSYTSEAGTNGSFGEFSTTVGQVSYKPSNSVTFDLFDVPQGSGTAAELGVFTLYGASNATLAGQLTFTSTQSVPEPSSYLLGAAGLLLLAVFRRRTTLRA